MIMLYLQSFFIVRIYYLITDFLLSLCCSTRPLLTGIFVICVIQDVWSLPLHEKYTSLILYGTLFASTMRTWLILLHMILIAFIKPLYILILKGSDYQSLFIVNSCKTSKYYPYFKAGRCHPRFINENAWRFYPCTTIKIY